MDILNFWLPSILMGLGIAVDVFLATLVQFRHELGWKNWTLPITITHILFPFVGYILFWSLLGHNSILTFLLGITGFLLVMLFLCESFCEWIECDINISVSDSITSFFSILGVHFSKNWLAILAVSWDALLSGPAKSAITTDWSAFEVFASFLIAGLVVAIVAQSALLLSFWLKTKISKSQMQSVQLNTIIKFDLLGKFLESSVIGGFGVLSLFTALSVHSANIYQSIIIMSFILGPFFYIYRNRLINVSKQDYYD